MYSPNVWNISVPPRVHMFLWLLSNNKLLTQDNLSKRQNLNDKTCLFCADLETVHHLLFDCSIMQIMWKDISQMTQKPNLSSFEAVATYWLSNKKQSVINMITSALLWSTWKMRNDIVFFGHIWMNMQEIWRRLLSLKRWQPLYPKNIQVLDRCLLLIDAKAREEVPWLCL